MASAPREPPPIRVALVITGLSTGGAELMLWRLLQHLDRQRFQPYVISLTDAGDLGERISALGIGLLELRMPRGRPTARAMLRLIRFLRQWRPSVVHTWMYHADLMGSLAAKLAGGFPVVWCIRASKLGKGQAPSLTHLTIRVCAALSHFVPARIVSCSHTAARVHIEAGYRPDKFVVIPNGFDLDLFRPLPTARDSVRAELGLRDDTPLVGMIGRFDPLKDHLGFLAAASKLQNSLPGVHFLLAGNRVDPTNQELTKAIATAGLLSAVHLLGQRTDVPRLLAGIDLVVSSSVSEGFPNTVAEAMACGAPCVVTDVGDSAFIVGETGRVVAALDTSALAEAMHALLSLSQESRAELGRAARARIKQLFEIRNVVKQYQTLYCNLADNRRACA